MPFRFLTIGMDRSSLHDIRGQVVSVILALQLLMAGNALGQPPRTDNNPVTPMPESTLDDSGASSPLNPMRPSLRPTSQADAETVVDKDQPEKSSAPKIKAKGSASTTLSKPLAPVVDVQDKSEDSDEEAAPEIDQPLDPTATPEIQPPSKPATVPEKVIASEHLLPGYTKAWVSIPDLDGLTESFEGTQFGKLSMDPKIEPFVESLKQQFINWASEKNVRLGIELENLEDIHSGEICLAGALPTVAGQKPTRGSHGLVLLVDVRGKEDRAEALMEKVNARLQREGAKQSELEINGSTVTRSLVDKGKRLRASQVTLQTIFKGWLLAADNEKIFRDVVFRIATTTADKPKPDALAAQPAFKSVMDRASLAPHTAHCRWFVDPFGYVKLAQALADDERNSRQQRDDWARILQEQGFDAIQSVGGNVGLLTDEHEVLHRTFVYIPQDNNANTKHKRVLGLFDFSNNTGKHVVPAEWVPADIAAVFVGKWNLESAFDNVGYLYDAFLDEKGAFDRLLQDFKMDPDMKLNVRKMVEQFDNEWTIVSSAERPITTSSERVVIGFRVKGDGEFVLNSIERATGRGNAARIKLAGFDVIEVDSSKQEELEDVPDIFDDPLADEDWAEEEDDVEEEFTLFNKRYFVFAKGHLLVANNKDYLKALLTSNKKSELLETPGYKQVDEALLKLKGDSTISSRQFGRVDRTLEANYEMLRQGKMENSQTVMAKIINQIIKHEKEENEDLEVKRLDGSKLPADFQKDIAPFLGLMGWINEVEDDGWRISGCVLKKEK